MVVVGAGIGGVRTVQRLRAWGHDGRIVVIGAEPHRPYKRPPLSKDVLAGGELAELPELLGAEAEDALDVDWWRGVRARALDTRRRVVVTDAGDVAYRDVVVATGVVARRVPGLPGLVLRTWDDAQLLGRQLAPDRVVAVVGAGVLGCEIAATAARVGCEVHLVDVAPGPMTRVVGPLVAAEISALHAEHGIRLHLATSVAVGGFGRLELSDGTGLDADVVVHAVGVEPDVAWLAGSGLDLAGGVVTDGRGRASVAGVHAVGDVAVWDGRRHEHWTAALEQADVVAADLVGRELPAPPVPYWWSDQHGVTLQGLGDTAAPDVWFGRWGPQRRRVALYARDGVLVGAVGFAAPAAVMPLRVPIQQGVPVAEVAPRLAATPATTLATDPAGSTPAG
ncbi:phenylpropionate dioxygenase ferredoxin reductase subunit [Jatrophihabitans endophyticus]|uniref:Phenylpropionate dioxygenase ferredoxin reductase subunit n=1 Tax=Jatrophihabitans endophyticus TaxID=1206085 RepID=A0A1M5PWI2_9ACTN|nr:phenylpropionate dioxygenase ferredoxin reductase subunit [Jatrophihabitans endophyticus]